MSRQKINILMLIEFVVGMIIIFFTQSWWPWLIFLIWTILVTSQILGGRPNDAMVSTMLLGTVFLSTLFQIDLQTMMLILAVIAGIYLIVREYLAIRG